MPFFRQRIIDCLLPSIVLVLLNTAIAAADDSFLQQGYACPGSQSLLPAFASSSALTADSTDDADYPITIEANRATASNNNQIDFFGDVLIQRNNQQLNAGQVRFFNPDQSFFAEQDIQFYQPGIRIQGSKAEYFSQTGQGLIQQSAYHLFSRPAQGIADSFSFKPGYMHLTRSTYSSCPQTSQDWYIDARELQLYTDEGYGEGEDITLYFKDVPIFYSPYLQFPIDERRRSGFLLPEIAYSKNNGFDISAPYYWNIAPEMDATITPRILSRRGLLTGAEFRYLDSIQSAELYGEFIRDQEADQLRSAEEIAERGDDITDNRGSFHFLHQAKLTPNWYSHINYNYASDNYYLDDFGNNLKDRSINHLLQQAQLAYINPLAKFSITTQAYQELRINQNTYSRLPQLKFSTYVPISTGLPLGAGLNAELVSFAKNRDYHAAANEGQRYHLRPYIEMPLNARYGFIKPRIGFDALSYQLTETASPAAQTDFDRQLPVLSVDSGLFFERPLNLFQSPMLQTLEPRLFYLYIPYKDQQQQPLFDTAKSYFSFNQLFRENRFSGIDRLGDANQITAAVTTRFIDDENGHEKLTASIGEIFYFDDRQVQLRATDKDETDYSSAIAAELSSRFHPYWNTALSMVYNPHQDQIDNSGFRLQYKKDNYHIANFDYTYKNDGSSEENYEQLDMSAYWKVAVNWRGIFRWNYSLQDDFSLETMLGLEYDSCCYALRLVLSREQAYQYDEADNKIMLQMQFKGLSSIGNISDATLASDIYGYEPTMDK